MPKPRKSPRLAGLPDMIARLWSAQTTPALSESYLHHFEQAVRPQLGKISGFLGCTVSTRPSPSIVELLVTTYWQSFSAIESFAGADRESAVVAEEGVHGTPRVGIAGVGAEEGVLVARRVIEAGGAAEEGVGRAPRVGKASTPSEEGIGSAHRVCTASTTPEECIVEASRVSTTRSTAKK